VDPRGSDIPFTPEEAAKIRENVRAARGVVLCPRCGTPLSSGFPAGSVTAGYYWLYRCLPCHRGLTIADARG
jgi:hypothetical protein